MEMATDGAHVLSHSVLIPSKVKVGGKHTSITSASLSAAELHEALIDFLFKVRVAGGGGGGGGGNGCVACSLLPCFHRCSSRSSL